MARRPESSEGHAERSHDERAWLQRLDQSIAKAPGASLSRTRPQSAREAEAPILVAPPHPATIALDALLSQCTFRRGRSSGPGGQHRNKVETLVELCHDATSVEAHAGERRTVTENHRVAVTRLRLALATRVRTGVPVGDCRSPLWRSRCKSGRIVVSVSHEDFPSMLAHALDVLWACDLDPKPASSRLCCTMSQLVKLVKDHPPAWIMLNAHRAARGMHGLK